MSEIIEIECQSCHIHKPLRHRPDCEYINEELEKLKPQNKSRTVDEGKS